VLLGVLGAGFCDAVALRPAMPLVSFRAAEQSPCIGAAVRRT
jgi:hypothetical protein